MLALILPYLLHVVEFARDTDSANNWGPRDAKGEARLSSAPDNWWNPRYRAKVQPIIGRGQREHTYPENAAQFSCKICDQISPRLARKQSAPVLSGL